MSFDLNKPSIFNRRWRSLLIYSSVIFGVPVLIGGTAGLHWGTLYLRQHVVPEIARDLSKSLNRPIHLGELESVSLGRIRLGESTIPATESDRDTVKIAAVEINFDPIQLIRQRKVALDVTLVRPEMFLDEEAPGEWLETEIDFGDDEQFEVRWIRLRDAKLWMAPLPRIASVEEQEDKTDLIPILFEATQNKGGQGGVAPHPSIYSASYQIGITQKKIETVDQNRNSDLADDIQTPEDGNRSQNLIVIESVNADVQLTEDAKQILFHGSAKLASGGQILLEGEVIPDDDFVNATVQAKDVAIAPLNAFLPADVTAETGKISGAWTVKLMGDRPLDLSGNAHVRQAKLWLEGEPNPFSDIDMQLQFEGEQVAIKEGLIRFGQIPFQVKGTIDPEVGLDLYARVDSVSAAGFMQTFQLDLPFPVTGTLKCHNLRVRGEPGEHLVFWGTVHDAQPIQLDRMQMASAQTEFVLEKFDEASRDRLILKNLEFSPAAGGRLKADADIWLGDDDEGQEDDIQVAIALQNLPTDVIAQTYGFKPPEVLNDADLTIGRLNATGKITVLHDNPQITVQWQTDGGTFPAQGKLVVKNDVLQLQETQIQVGDGQLTLQGQLSEGNWQAALEGKGIQLSKFVPQLPGVLQGSFDLAGNLDQPATGLQVDGKAIVQLPEGTVQATGKLANGRWQSVVQGEAIPLRQVLADVPVPTGTLTGEFTVSGDLENLSLQAIAAQGAATLQLAEGSVHATGSVTHGKWQSVIQTTSLPLQSFLPEFPGFLNGEFTFNGDLNHLRLDAIAAQGNATLRTTDGELQAAGEAIAGNWNATVTTAGLQTAAFLPNFPGQFAGDVKLTGNLQNLSPGAIQAEGEVHFAGERLTFLRSPLSADIRWTGERLEIQNAIADGLRVDGWVDAQFTENLKPEIAEMNLQIFLKEYNLKTLPFALPESFKVNGLTDFSGRLTGTIETPQLTGQVELKEFSINQFSFAPQLAGEIAFAPQRGLMIDLEGDRNQLLLRLDRDFLPQTISLHTKDIHIEGRRGIDWTGDRTPFILQIRELPLETVGRLAGELLPVQSLSGKVTGAFDLDLASLQNPNIKGWFTVARPMFGNLQEETSAHHEADFFHSKLAFADGTLSLSEGVLRFGGSRFQLAGQFAPQQDAEFSAQLTTDRGNLQDIVTVMRWLQPSGKTLPTDLSAIQGQFQAQFDLAGSNTKPLTAQASLQGQNWQWRNFMLQNISLTHLRFTDDVLTIPKAQLIGILYRPTNARSTDQPLAFQNLSLKFSGSLGMHASTGQMKAENIPIPLVLDLMGNPPLPVDGSVDAIVTLSGSMTNPELQGIVNLSNVWAIGVIQIKNELSFRYHNAQFEID